MTEHDEGRLVAALRAIDRGPAPEGLREQILAIPAIEPVRSAVQIRARRGHATATLLAAAATLVAVTGGLALLGGGADHARPSPLASVLVTPEPTAIAAPAGVARGVRLISWPAGEVASGELVPGTYALPKPFGTSDYTRIILSLPDGWTFSDGRLHKGLGDADRIAIEASPVSGVYADPCHWRAAAPEPFHHHHPDDGSTVIDTAALLGQLDVGVAPLEVDLAGQAGLLLRMSVPDSLDIASCDGGEIRRWTASQAPNTTHGRSVPGESDIVYFVDVDRQALLVLGSAGPEASAEDRAELEAILTSMVIMR